MLIGTARCWSLALGVRELQRPTLASGDKPGSAWRFGQLTELCFCCFGGDSVRDW